MNVKKKITPEKRIIELEDKWKRALADYHNLENRIIKEKKDFISLTNAELIGKILPGLDDLERAEQHLQDQGLSLALDKLKEIFKKEGLIEIKAAGEEFNPELMDAVEIVPGPKNKVITVLDKGYLLNDKVLRHAKVKVGGDILSDKNKKRKDIF